MRLTSTLLAFGALAIAVPASAGVVFSDNFDGEAGGNSALNYSGFANFAVTGNVDVVKSGDFGITCSGSCVDLDGSSGPGKLTSLSSFAFNSGDVVRLSFLLGGSQRTSAFDDYFVELSFGGVTSVINYGFNWGSGDVVVFPSVSTPGIYSSTGIAGNDPFGPQSVFFTAGSAGTLKFSIGTTSADNVGPLLDNVKLTIDAGAVPEPATWAMMFAGFGMVGAAMRRREKVAVTFA